MNTIRSGKIARLPPAIREQLNERLANYESSTPLLAWLNALPEVQAVLAQEFGGEVISRVNIRNWRQGGHAEWRRQREAREIVKDLHADGHELTKVAGGSVVNITAQWLAARYAVGMKQWQGQGGDPAAAWNRMREFCRDIVALQRGERLAQRLEFERGRAELATGPEGRMKKEE
ncbi:MAG: hypothetical protein JF609_02140 [Verrucomicrobia bacterium]|nr:hypothetical protein [Verrucomicrobiota bacterium]